MLKTKVILKKDVRDLSYESLVEYLAAISQKSFRADQIFDWIYKKGAKNFNSMTNLPPDLKDKLKEDFLFAKETVVKKQKAEDDTAKFLMELCDQQKVESVLIPAVNRATVCVSTQAGCKFHCGFCASGIGGWSRDLSSAEIIAQVLYAKEKSHPHPLSHIVFMGTGEPLDNYENVVNAIKIINSEKGLNIAARRITVSTCGLIPEIKRLAKEGIQVELAVSLHGSSDSTRNVIMPINKKYPVKDLIETCKEYINSTHRQITFEYILIKDVTCTEKSARELGALLKGMTCKVNLIPYNKVEEFNHEVPSKKEMFLFRNLLVASGVHATIRVPRGRDVSAACGQLRHSE